MLALTWRPPPPPLKKKTLLSSALDYGWMIQLFSRGVRSWRSAPCFSSTIWSLHLISAAQEKKEEMIEEEWGGGLAIIPEGVFWEGMVTKTRVMERRTGGIKLPTRRRLDGGDRWIKELTEERITFLYIRRRFLRPCAFTIWNNSFCLFSLISHSFPYRLFLCLLQIHRSKDAHLCRPTLPLPLAFPH